MWVPATVKKSDPTPDARIDASVMPCASQSRAFPSNVDRNLIFPIYGDDPLQNENGGGVRLSNGKPQRMMVHQLKIYH